MEKQTSVLLITLLFITFAAVAQNDKKGTIRVKKDSAVTAIVAIPQERPEFVGGDAKMYWFIEQNITYPPGEKQKRMEGVVTVGFIVEKDGTVSSVQVLKGVPGAPALDAEAMRVVMLMPKWKPGTTNNVAVRSACSIPIRFNL